MRVRPIDQSPTPVSEPVYILQGERHRETELQRRLRRSGLSNPVETLSPDAVSELKSATPAGVVCLCGSGDAEQQGTRLETDGQGGAETGYTDARSTVASVVDTGVDCPVVVVGVDVDVAAAYDAGATDVVPLRIADHPDTIVEKITTTIGRSQHERFLSDLIDETTDGILVHDPQTGEILACNERFYRMLGVDPATRSITLADISGHDEEFTRERAVSLIRQAADGTPTTFEWKDPTNEGGDIWVEVKLESATLAGQQYVVGSARDIGVRKERERKLRESQATLRRLHEITADPDLTTDERVRELLAFGAAELGMGIGFLSRIDPEAGEFEVVEAQGEHPLIQAGKESALEETYCRRVLEEGDPPVAIRDAEAAGMADDPAYEKFGLGCYLGAEIVVNGELYGTLCFADDSPRQRPFSDTEEALIDHMAQWLRQELQQQEYVRELEESKEQQRRIFERIDDAFFAVDTEWRVQYVNEAGASVLRAVMDAAYDRDDLIGRHLWEEIPDAVETAFYEQYHRAMDDQRSVSFEEHYEPLDVWFDVRAYPDDDGLSVYFTDITDRKQREQKLERYETILESIEDAVYAIESDGTITYVNEQYASMKGVDRDALIGTNIYEWVDDETATRADAVRQRLEEGDRDVGILEYDFRSVDGEETPVEMRFAPIGDASEDSRRVGVIRDISERMERRQELRQYETLFETVRDKLYTIDEDGYVEMVSQSLAETLGYDIDELQGNHVSEFLTDETVTDGERRILDLLVTPESVSSTYEGTLESRDGAQTPVEIELSLLPYDDHFNGTVGAVRDISERQQREEELRIFRKALTDAGIGLAMYDESGRFEYVNDHYAQLLGRTPEDIQAAPVWEAFEELNRQTFDSYWRSFALGETRTEATEHRRDDGSTVPVETVTTAVEVDGIEHRILTVREITERQERRQQSEVLQRLIRHNLRNDLTVILGHSGMLEDDLDGTNAEVAEKIDETANQLRGLTETAQKAQEIIGREIVRKPIDVVSLLEDEIRSLETEFDVAVETDLPQAEFVLADAPLREAFHELLVNAVEHSDSAVPSISVRMAPATDRSGWIDIEIADDGPGIPENEVATLTAGEETPLQHGSGIGLWIIHWAVTRYGGDLEFETGPEGGSLVRIRLPLADPQADPTREMPPASDGEDGRQTR